MRSRTLTLLALVLLASLGPAFAGAPAPSLVVENAWLRKPPGVDVAAVYMVLKNVGSAPVSVVGASTPVAHHAMIHETSTVGGQSRMRPHAHVEIGPGQKVTLAPRGLHLMLSGFTRQVSVGEKVPLTLELADGGQVQVTAVVRPFGTE